MRKGIEFLKERIVFLKEVTICVFFALLCVMGTLHIVQYVSNMINDRSEQAFASCNECSTQVLTQQINSSPKWGIKVNFFPNPCVIDFVMREPVAPDYFVGYGEFVDYQEYLDSPERDPKNIGVERALRLADQIINLEGVEEAYAENYTFNVTIAESYVIDREKIVEKVLEILHNDSSLR